MTDFVNTKTVSLSKSEIDNILELFPQGIVYCDLETTGLSPMIDKVIEVSAVKVTPRGVETFDTLVNPIISITPFSTEIHGITDFMVSQAPYIGTVLPQFFNFIDDLPLFAHNARFDLGFLVFAAHQEGFEFTLSPIYDSCRLSRLVFTDAKNHKLGNLSEELNISLVNHHRALDDALAGLRITASLFQMIKDKNIDAKHALKECYLFNMDHFKKNKDYNIPQHLLPLRRVIESNGVVEIFYRGGTIKNSFRPIRPVSFLPLPTGNVLYSLCLVTGMYKSFNLSKIKEVRYPDAQRIKELLLLKKKE